MGEEKGESHSTYRKSSSPFFSTLFLSVSNSLFVLHMYDLFLLNPKYPNSYINYFALKLTFFSSSLCLTNRCRRTGTTGHEQVHLVCHNSRVCCYVTRVVCPSFNLVHLARWRGTHLPARLLFPSTFASPHGFLI